jgi:hypothetical protein
MDGAEVADRFGAEAWIGELLDEPHTGQVLTALLAGLGSPPPHS